MSTLKNIILLTIGCCLLSACGHTSVNLHETPASRYAQTNTAAPPFNAPSTITIVSFNTKQGKATKKFFQRLQTFEKAPRPDILCLQEMNVKNVEWLAEAMQYNYVFYPSSDQPHGLRDLGSAILSPWPIQKDFKVSLPYGMDDKFFKINRAATAAHIQIHEHAFLIYSVHLGVMLSPKKREGQIRAIIESIPQEIKTCIITGDFNTYAVMHTRTLELLINANFLHATAHVGGTYTYWYLLNRKAALDHVFVRGAKVLDAGKIPGKTGSDHLPVWVEVKI